MGNLVNYAGFSGNLEETSCPTCGPNAGKKLLFKEDEIGFYQCEQCNLQYASPRFTESSMLDIYEQDNFTNEYEDFRNWNYTDWVASKDRSYTVSLKKIELAREYLPEQALLLDVGCSIGLTVLLANQNGLRAEGIEPSKELFTIAKDKIGVPVQNTQIQDFNNESLYDGIIIWDVLEHLYDPLEVLKACSKRLRSGGHLFAQIPNHRGMGNKAKELMCRAGLRKTFKHFGFPWHVYSFDQESLSKMFAKAGLASIRFESWPSALMDAKTDPVSRLNIFLAKKYALTDYITVVARKN